MTQSLGPLLLQAVVVGAFLAFFGTIRMSRTSVATLWLVTVLVVPPWINVEVGGNRIPVAALTSLAVILNQRRNAPKWRLIDGFALALGVTAVIATFTGLTPRHVAIQAVAEWLLPYAAGRFAVDRERFVAVASRVAVTLSLLAIVQFVTQFDISTVPPFDYTNGRSFWMGLQERGGFARAELTMGHSIALGGTLALLAPFAIVHGRASSDAAKAFSRGSLWRLAVVSVGVATTISRGALIALLTVIVLVVLFLGINWFLRVMLALALPAAGVLALNFYEGLATTAQGRELNTSSDYREGLLQLLDLIEPIGLAPGGSLAADGVTYTWLGYYSIDNALLYVALYLGAVAALLYLWVPLHAGWKSIRSRRAGTGAYALAVVAQVPLMLTVAPITQYQNIFWLIVGATATVAMARDEPEESEPEPETSRPALQPGVWDPQRRQLVGRAPRR